MTSSLTCEALREDIVALLYDDGEASERSRARDHIAQCVPCRLEYSELKGVRKVLGGWDLPAIAPPVQARSSFRWVHTGLAAAAGLVLGIGVAVAGRSTFFPSSDLSTPPAAVAQAPSSAPPGSSSREVSNAQFVSYETVQDMLKTQEARHQAEIDDLRRALIQTADASSPGGGSARTVANVSTTTIEKLLKASEERQARMIEARLAGMRNESDLQRQYDMAQIAAGLAYIDSRTGADAARTSELMKNLVRVTAKPQDR